MKRCSAKTRHGTPCQRFALKLLNNGRCRLHGGLSTGAKTGVGKQRQLVAKTKHGYYAKAAIKQRRELKQLLKEARALTKMAENYLNDLA